MNSSLSPKKPIAGFHDEIWLTVTEVSNLAGLNVATIRESCAERHGKYRGGTYVFRKHGKRYQILLASLPEAAQYKYWLEHHQPVNSALPATVQEQENSPIDHEVLEVIADNYSRKVVSIKEKSQRRTDILDEYMKLLAAGIKKGKALEIIKSRHENITKPTLWRWIKRVKGYPRQYWEILLAPDYQGRCRTEIHPAAWDYFCDKYGQLSEPDATVIYRETVKAAKCNGWGELPSCKTFLRRWNEAVPENVKILLRKGKKALKECLPHLKRDYTTLGVHEVWESDLRKADVFVLWPDGTTDRPWCAVIRDVRTRMPLAIKVYKTANAELVIDAFRNAVLLTGTLPINFHLDNGTEYSNNPFTGGQKSHFRYYIKVNQPVGILTRMGVNVIWATPYHGAAKAIESWWNVIAGNVDKLFGDAYTGKDATSRPENSDKKHAIPVDQYTKFLSASVVSWAKGEFGQHRGQGMNGLSPLDLYNQLMHGYTKVSISIEHIRAMRPMVFRRVLSMQKVFQLTIPGFGKVEYTPQDNIGVKRGYSYDILPDPADPREPALIYDGAKFMGEASYKYHTPYLSETAGKEISKKRNSDLRKANAAAKALKQRIKQAESPLIVSNEGLSG